MKKIFSMMLEDFIAVFLVIFTLGLFGYKVSVERMQNTIPQDIHPDESEKFTASLSGENVWVVSPPATPGSGQILYCIRDSCYWVDQSVAQYIDSLRAAAVSKK